MRRILFALLLVVLAHLSISSQPAADVVIVAGAHLYHVRGCTQTSAYSDAYLRTVARSTLGPEFKPCAVCRPDSGAPTATSSAALPKELEELWSRYDAAEIVSIVLGQRTTGLYHRKGCHWTQNGQNQIFSRKEADSRYFQAHQECMRRPPGTFTQEAEEALRGGPAPGRSLVAPPTGSATPPAATAGTTPPSPRPSGPRLMNTERQQCAATTKKGTRCSRMAQSGRSYCWQHP